MIRRGRRVSLTKMLIAIWLINMVLYPAIPVSKAAAIFKQNGTADQGGFQDGGYDNSAVQPTPYNWVGQSGFNGPAAAEENWAVEFPGREDTSSMTSMAVGSDNTMYMTINSDFFGSVDGKLYYFIEGDPTQVKVFSIDSEPFLSPPVIDANGLLYIGGVGKIFAIDTNRLKSDQSKDPVAWTHTSDDPEERFENPPAIGSDGTVYFPSDKGALYALNEDGTRRWKFVSAHLPASPFLTPVVDKNGVIYVAESEFSKSTIYALDDDSTLINQLDLGRGVHTPVVSADGMIYAPSRGSQLYVINAESFIQQTVTSATYATTSDGGTITSSPAIGPDGKIYATGFGRLYELDPDVFNTGDTADDVTELVYDSGSGNEVAPPLFDKDGHLYLVELRESKVYRFDKNDADPTGWSKTWEFVNDHGNTSPGGEGGNPFYTSPVIDANGNLLVASYYRFDNTSVLFSIGPDVTGPFPESSYNAWVDSAARVTDDRIVLFFNEQLDKASLPDPGAFTVTDHGNQVNVTKVEVPEFPGVPDDELAATEGLLAPNAVLILHLAHKVLNGRQVLVSYQSDGSHLRDQQGNVGPSFSDLAAFDMTKPEILDGQVINGNIVLTFDEKILFEYDPDQLSLDKNLTVSVNGKEAAIQGISTDEDKMMIQLAQPVQPSDSVKISYDNKGITFADVNTIWDAIVDDGEEVEGNLADNFTEYPVTLWGNDKTNVIEGNLAPGDQVEYSVDNGSSWQPYDLNNPVKFTGNQTVWVRVNEGTPKVITFTDDTDGGGSSGGDSSGGGGGGGGSAPPAKTADNQSNHAISVNIGGEQKSISLDNIEAKNGEFSLEITDGGPRIEIMIPVDIIQQWKKDYPNGLIHFKTPKATYVLPFGALNLEELLQNASGADGQGKEIYVKVIIATAADEEKEDITRTANRLGVQTVGDPIEFSVEIVKDGDSIIWVPGGDLVTDGEQNKELKSFSGYILRSIYVNENIDPNKTVAALYVPVNQDFYPLPTRTVHLEDGRTEVVFQRPGNSIYTVINHEKTFKDIKNHWAEQEIELLANKLLVAGRTEESFDPDGAITRAEFSALLVRALGLQGMKTDGQIDFTDTPAVSWYYQELKAAVHSGLIKGYENQTFRPANKITREEMATMLNRALAFIGEDHSAANAEQVLARFADSNHVSAFAATDMASMINKGIIHGKGNHQLAPKDDATRAEAVAMLKRFLEYVKFL